MIAAAVAPPSISSSACISSQPLRDRIFRRSSFSSVRPAARSPAASRSVSAFYASAAAERERETSGGYYYSFSSQGSGGSAAAAAATGTLYDVLGLTAGATGQEIKAAYRRLARACHPDVAGAPAADEFMRIHAAYTTLSDPDERADYDRMMLSSSVAGQRRRAPFYRPASPPYASPSSAAPSSSSHSGFARRTWETDQCW